MIWKALTSIALGGTAMRSFAAGMKHMATAPVRAFKRRGARVRHRRRRRQQQQNLQNIARTATGNAAFTGLAAQGRVVAGQNQFQNTSGSSGGGQSQAQQNIIQSLNQRATTTQRVTAIFNALGNASGQLLQQFLRLPFAILGFVGSIHRFADRLVDLQRGTAQYSGPMSLALANLDTQRIFREMRVAGGTQASFVGLVNSLNKLEQAMTPFRSAMTNFMNIAGTVAAGGATMFLERLSDPALFDPLVANANAAAAANPLDIGAGIWAAQLNALQAIHRLLIAAVPGAGNNPHAAMAQFGQLTQQMRQFNQANQGKPGIPRRPVSVPGGGGGVTMHGN